MNLWIDPDLSAIYWRINVTWDGDYYLAWDTKTGENFASLSQDDNDEWIQHDGDEFTNPRGWVEWLRDHLE